MAVRSCLLEGNHPDPRHSQFCALIGHSQLRAIRRKKKLNLGPAAGFGPLVSAQVFFSVFFLFSPPRHGRTAWPNQITGHSPPVHFPMPRPTVFFSRPPPVPLLIHSDVSYPSYSDLRRPPHSLAAGDQIHGKPLPPHTDPAPPHEDDEAWGFQLPRWPFRLRKSLRRGPEGAEAAG